MNTEIVRYTFAERLIHWFGGLTYVYLLMSGLALYSPYLYWMASVLGGGPAVRYWHPWVGLLFVIVIGMMHKLWRADMRITDADRRWTREVRHYVRNEDEKMPAVDRFNAGQKQFYWVMFGGAILLLLSGLIMWIPEYLPGDLNWVRQVAIVIHVIAALVTIGAFIIHVYMGVFVVPGGLRAILHGQVSDEWARTHHRLWFDRRTEPRP
jgi:formate dehydrogenase subunit gamma